MSFFCIEALKNRLQQNPDLKRSMETSSRNFKISVTSPQLTKPTMMSARRSTSCQATQFSALAALAAGRQSDEATESSGRRPNEVAKNSGTDYGYVYIFCTGAWINDIQRRNELSTPSNFGELWRGGMLHSLATPNKNGSGWSNRFRCWRIFR